MVLSLPAVRVAGQDAGLVYDALVKMGVEADTNPERLSGGGSDSDFVERLFMELNLASRNPGQAVTGRVRVGAKRFHRVRDEDALVFDVDGAFNRLLVREFGVYLRLNARNRSEQGHVRDYVRIGGQVGLSWLPRPLSFTVGPALSYFLWRPDSEFSYSGVGGSTSVGWAASEAVRLSASYTYQRRDYAQPRVVSDPDTGLRLDEDTARLDDSHLAGVSLQLQYSFLAQLDLLYQRNASNSFGRGYSRLLVRASVTAALPLSLWLTAQATLQRTYFDDNVLIDPTLAIDEDNRNAVIVSLTGDIVDWLRWELRYNLYLQAFGGDEEDYARHLFYGGLVGVVDE